MCMCVCVYLATSYVPIRTFGRSRWLVISIAVTFFCCCFGSSPEGASIYDVEKGGRVGGKEMLKFAVLPCRFVTTKRGREVSSK